VGNSLTRISCFV